ncbi:hypothetical protein [Deinococcus radiophilus]|uniref:Lipoprotein n=1 Tax=Deinococcus radiophilus TaxID=32062 RepID=A0A3S0KMU1_9DEIO|nr:hypothetical protein [Deinococcus radiophilus]RTR30336.1 hypothetical protein EJ104_02215 [Deinococcus radiophilus]UFA49865.1 hypothetical protein LMT64_08175 [Deinococcus radiophilus]
MNLTRALLLALLPAGLGACTMLQPAPAIPNASLNVSTSQVQLQPGKVATVQVNFNHALYNEDPGGRYRLSVDSPTQDLRISPFLTSLSARDMTVLYIEAARNAREGQHRVFVYVTDSQGRTLTESFGVRIQPVKTQAAPVIAVPLPGGQPRPVTPAPVVPVPLP